MILARYITRNRKGTTPSGIEPKEIEEREENRVGMYTDECDIHTLEWRQCERGRSLTPT
jgi:hypothetical protein